MMFSCFFSAAFTRHFFLVRASWSWVSKRFFNLSKSPFSQSLKYDSFRPSTSNSPCSTLACVISDSLFGGCGDRVKRDVWSEIVKNSVFSRFSVIDS